MSRVQALVLTGDGINCEEETAFACQQAGAHADIVHISQLIETPLLLDRYQWFLIPGGFSFGDEVSSGKILAMKLRYVLGEVLQNFIAQDRVVLGTCNGFQALVKLGVLPKSELMTQQLTLTHNRQRRYINRWVTLQTEGESLFFEGIESLMLPIRHGEGRLMVSPDMEEAMRFALQPHIALRYKEDVNGSFLNIAGLLNERGNVLGLMPHPEAFVRWTQHPAWANLDPDIMRQTPPGLRLFQNIVKALEN